MRIHKPIAKNMKGVQNTFEAIQSELEFLSAWSSHSEFPVQTPIPNLNGEWLSSVIIEGEEIYCSVLEWIFGDTISREDFTDEIAVSSFGEHIAYFHQFSQNFKPSSGFIRPEYGVEWVNTMLTELRSGKESGVITNTEFQVLDNAFSLVTNRMKELSKMFETWGFIHSDIHNGNLIHSSRGISLIDFGLSGFGYYAMDVAIGTLSVKNELRDSLLTGYNNIISEKINIARLEDFMFLMSCRSYAFMVGRKDKHKWIREHIPDLIENLCKPLLEGKSFFYKL